MYIDGDTFIAVMRQSLLPEFKGIINHKELLPRVVPVPTTVPTLVEESPLVKEKEFRTSTLPAPTIEPLDFDKKQLICSTLASKLTNIFDNSSFKSDL